MPNDKFLRDRQEIQRVHDLLWEIINGRIPIEFADSPTKVAILVSLDCLCWILGHDHNRNFAGNIAKIEKDAKAHGFELRFKDSPFDDLEIDLP